MFCCHGFKNVQNMLFLGRDPLHLIISNQAEEQRQHMVTSVPQSLPGFTLSSQRSLPDFSRWAPSGVAPFCTSCAVNNMGTLGIWNRLVLTFGRVKTIWKLEVKRRKGGVGWREDEWKRKQWDNNNSNSQGCGKWQSTIHLVISHQL